MECKVGIIYSEKAQVSKNRMKILDKRTYATTHGVKEFREEFITEWYVMSIVDTNLLMPQSPLDTCNTPSERRSEKCSQDGYAFSCGYNTIQYTL